MRQRIMESPQEWYQCAKAGSAAVRRTYELPQFHRRGLPRLSVYHLPSFQDCYGWTVYQLRGEADYKLQTVIWRQSADGQRMEDLMSGRITHTAPEPTLEEFIAGIEAEWFKKQLAALSEIRIPLVVNRPIGCDGESFGVHVQHQFDVEWWCDGPPEWASLANWTYDCIKTFRQSSSG